MPVDSSPEWIICGLNPNHTYLLSYRKERIPAIWKKIHYCKNVFQNERILFVWRAVGAQEAWNRAFILHRGIVPAMKRFSLFARVSRNWSNGYCAMKNKYVCARRSMTAGKRTGKRPEKQTPRLFRRRIKKAWKLWKKGEWSGGNVGLPVRSVL